MRQEEGTIPEVIPTWIQLSMILTLAFRERSPALRFQFAIVPRDAAELIPRYVDPATTKTTPTSYFYRGKRVHATTTWTMTTLTTAPRADVAHGDRASKKSRRTSRRARSSRNCQHRQETAFVRVLLPLSASEWRIRTSFEASRNFLPKGVASLNENIRRNHAR